MTDRINPISSFYKHPDPAEHVAGHSMRQILSANILLAVGYFLGGYFGTLLSIPPSHASPIWPAAGIAFAGVVTYGKRVIPGLFVGALLAQIFSFLDDTSPDGLWFSLFIGSIASVAATFQAYLGALLTRRYVGFNNPLTDDRSILQFIALGGPISCTVSASVGILSLYLKGAVDFEDIVTSWLTWWAGDTIGVLIFAPLLLCFIGVLRNRRSMRINSVALPLIVLSLLVIIILHFGKQQEAKRITTLFQEHCSLLHNALQNDFTRQLETNQNIKAFFESSPGVTADNFHNFTNVYLQETGNQTLIWLPRITHAERPAAEKRLHTVFFERLPAAPGVKKPAPAQEAYYPITYVEPSAAYTSLIGMVLPRYCNTFGALNKAVSGGEASAAFIDDLLPAADAPSAVILTPVYRDADTVGNEPQTSGVIANIFQIAPEIQIIKHQFSHLRLMLKISDQDTTLFDETRQNPTLALDFPVMVKTLPLHIADHTWQVVYTPAPLFFNEQLNWNIWWLILGCFALTGMAGIGLLMLTGRTMQTEEEVKLRTRELEENERFLRTIIETEPECVKIADRQGKLLNMNRAGLNMLEVDSLAAAQRYTMLDFVLPEHRAAFIDLHKRVLIGQHGTLEFEIVGRKGTRRWLETYAAPLPDASGAIALMLAVTRDISIRKRSEAELRLGARVFEQSHEGFMITDAEHRILKINPAFSAITGYDEYDAIGKNASILSSGRHDREFYGHIWETIAKQNFWQGEIWNRRKNGEIFPELLNISVVRDHAGNISEYVGVFADITQIKASEAQLEFLAHHDTLTSLPNRLRLFFRLEHSIANAKRNRTQLALLMLDLDRFKDVNDSFGHLVGDQLLQMVAKRLVDRVRNIDTVARLGGDEFTVVLENIAHTEDAARIAQAIIADISEPWSIPNAGEVLIGTSIGISLFPQHGHTPELLLQQADAALYKAKESGRNRFAFFSNEFTDAARRRIDLEGRLRRALLHDELQIYYQPQIDIATGAIVGAEALTRWFDPIEGMIPPSVFIPIAEQTGLIQAIGAWVLKEVCRQGRAWLDQGLQPISLAVNVSQQQMRQSDISHLVAEVLHESGYPANQLEMELTESGLMERQDDVIDILNNIRAQGVRIAIDDFGTGYSSLAYLKRFPLNVLKIDKNFIDDIPHQQDDMEIAATIIAMGHILGFKVLAEGVETPEQLAFLKDKGCDLFQGFLVSKPLPAQEFSKLLKSAHGTTAA